MPDREIAGWQGNIRLDDDQLCIDAPDAGAAIYRLAQPIDLTDHTDAPLFVEGRQGDKWDEESGAYLNIFLRDSDGTTIQVRMNNWGLPRKDQSPSRTATDTNLGDGKVSDGGDGEIDFADIVAVELKGNWSQRELSLVLVALNAGKANEASLAGADREPPKITHIGVVSPNVLGVTIEAQDRVAGRQVPYVEQQGDSINEGHNRWITRGGRVIGSLVGRDDDLMMPFDEIEGAPLNIELISQPDAFRLASRGDVAHPIKIYRKSKPTDEVRTGPWSFAYPKRHVLYLEFVEPLIEGTRYELALTGHDPEVEPVEWVFNADRLRSEAVRVSHVGFRPDDLVKLGYLSLWMGDGGAMSYEEGMEFRVIDEAGRSVFRGQSELSLAKDQTEAGRGRNYSLTDVYRLDFSELREPGTYRLVVDGVGCSYPFEIRDGVWEDAFKVSMMGLLHHRSGVELGPPFTDYRRPRTMVPGENGFEVMAATTPMRNPDGTQIGQGEIFERLEATATEDPLPHAWGGYMDAGDWDRRVQHLVATRLLLELYEHNPDYFAGSSLSLPPQEQANDLPDILDEALFNLDLYRRLQQPDGGVRGWVESTSHPRYGEASWQESLPVYATDADSYASYLFAATAARFARVAEDVATPLASEYADAAERAFDWSETQLSAAGWNAEAYAIRDARNLAAIELYRLRGTSRFHDVAVATTAFNQPRQSLQQWKEFHQREAGASYAHIQDFPVDASIQRNAREALLAEADDRAAMTMETGFGWTNDRMAWVGWGQQSALVNSLTLVRAHMLTGDDRYLAAIQRAVQFGVGANPLNIALTTGVGHDWPRHPLHVDSHVTGQPAPSGITIYGPDDPTPRGPDAPLYWANKKMADAGAIYPDIRDWPALESHWDIKMHPASSEYTIMQTIGPTAYLWGYLASHDASRD
ncbi:MAG: glycoside hydrolase family 9 protein [Planctomycetota bacterium]